MLSKAQVDVKIQKSSNLNCKWKNVFIIDCHSKIGNGWKAVMSLSVCLAASKDLCRPLFHVRKGAASYLMPPFDGQFNSTHGCAHSAQKPRTGNVNAARHSAEKRKKKTTTVLYTGALTDTIEKLYRCC